jgi:hypothetical protein
MVHNDYGARIFCSISLDFERLLPCFTYCLLFRGFIRIFKCLP